MLCQVCDQEKMEFQDTFYWGTELFGDLSYYYIYQVVHKVCLDCCGVLEPSLKTIQEEYDQQRVGAAVALHLVAKNGLAPRSHLEDLTEDCARFFAEDFLQTLKATVKWKGNET